MIIFIIYGVLILIYVAMPFWVQLIFTAINTWLPDPIPLIDEIIMYGALVGKIMNVLNVFDWIYTYRRWCQVHRFLGTIINLCTLSLVAFGIWKLVTWIF